jgi:hypothetical protein
VNNDPIIAEVDRPEIPLNANDPAVLAASFAYQLVKTEHKRVTPEHILAIGSFLRAQNIDADMSMFVALTARAYAILSQELAKELQ